MDRLVVDTGVLREAGEALRAVALEFQAANSRSEDFADAIGHRGLAGAVCEFAHNWDDKRSRMVKDIADLAEAATATADTVEYVDRSLGRALLGLPPVDVLTGSPLPAGPPARPVLGPLLDRPRPIDWTPLASRDPVPGNPEVVAQAAAHYAGIAQAISTAAARLRAISALESMQSEAVDMVRQKAEKVAADIQRAHRRYTETGLALRTYAPLFQQAQETTDAARRQAEAGAELIAKATAQMANAKALPDPIAAQTAISAARLLLEDGEREFRLARTRFDEAVSDHETAAVNAERAINSGRSGDGLGDGWRDDLRGAVAPFLKSLARIADLVAAATGVLALLTIWCPPLSAALGAVATYSAAVALAAHSLLLLLGDGSVGDVVKAAIALSAFTLGKVAVDAFRATALGTRASAWISASQWARQAPAVRAAAGLTDEAGHTAAVRTMMGSHESWGSAAAAAHTAQRSLQEGVLPSGAAAWRTVKAIPGRTWDDLSGFRPNQIGTGIDDFKVSGGFSNPLNLFGEAGAARELAAVRRIAAPIQAEAAVVAGTSAMKPQVGIVAGLGLTGSGLTAWDATHFGSDTRDPADLLMLDGHR